MGPDVLEIGGCKLSSRLLLGTGGAARAALVALRSLDIRSVCIQARDVSEAYKLAVEFGLAIQPLPFDAPIDTDGLIQSTPLGMTGMIPLDVDLQDPPETIAPMLAKWRAGFDVVYGVRDNRESDSLPKRLTADLYYRAHNWLSQDKIPEHAGDFRLLDRRVVEVIKAMPERNRFMKGLFAWAGFKSSAVLYHREERAIGTTKFNYWKLWTLAVDGITSASTVPLRVWSYVGGAVALFALGYAIFIVIRTLVSGIDVPGYASMMVAVLFLGGLQLFSLGVLGEYVGRILTEVKHRPLYVVREKIGGDD